MENLQTLNDFPTIDVWVDTDGSPLIKVDYDYLFQGKVLNLNSDYAFNGLFVHHFKTYTKSINIKTVGQDIVNQDNINLIVSVCPDCNNVVDTLENITPETYNWCKNNNVKIAVCLTRETISPTFAKDLDLVILDCLVNRNFDPSIVKIIYNAYGYLDNMVYTDYLVPIDTMRRTLKLMVDDTINDPNNIKLTKDRTHNFSLLTGTLYNRWHRVAFLANCHDLDLLDSKFFYTIYMPNRERDLYYIRHANDVNFIKDIDGDPKLHDKVKASEPIFQHKTYNKNGEIMVSADMYKTMDEYFIPPQVLDSYVHVVLETISYAPSVTEKLFKPIVAGLPFVWHGCQNILPYLESLGFKRYDGIDYSFDSHPDPSRRMDLLIEEVKRLSTINLKQLALSNDKTSKHNQHVFELISRDYNDLWKHLK